MCHGHLNRSSRSPRITGRLPHRLPLLAGLVSCLTLLGPGGPRGAGPGQDGPFPAHAVQAAEPLAGRQADPLAGRLGPPVRDQERTFQLRIQHWKSLRQRQIVMQRTDYSCGAAALATIVRYYWGDDVDEAFFLRAILATLTREQLEDRIRNGLSMTDLRQVAIRRGYAASLGSQELERLRELKVPVIVRIKTNGHEHFVVLRGVVENQVFLADPLRGHVRLPLDEFARQWPDRVLLVVAKPGSDLRPDSRLLVQPGEATLRRPEWQAVQRNLTLPPTGR